MPDSDVALMGEAYRFVQDRVKRPRALASSMQDLIAVCRGLEPHPDWAPLSALDFDSGKKELNVWLAETLRQEPPDPEIHGLWFGLFNPVCGDGPDLETQATADLYVGGSMSYEESDAGHEWAADLTYFPDGRYAGSTILSTIYSLAYARRDGLGNSAEYPLSLGFAVFWMREVLDHQELRSLVAGGAGRGVAVGFDSGDAIDFGVVSDHGEAGA